MAAKDPFDWSDVDPFFDNPQVNRFLLERAKQAAEEKPSPQEIQFAGFAKLLLADLLKTGDVSVLVAFHDDWQELWERIISRRAFDLVKHVLEFVPHLINAEIGPEVTFDMLAGSVPDLTHLSEVNE